MILCWTQRVSATNIPTTWQHVGIVLPSCWSATLSMVRLSTLGLLDVSMLSSWLGNRCGLDDRMSINFISSAKRLVFLAVDSCLWLSFAQYWFKKHYAVKYSDVSKTVFLIQTPLAARSRPRTPKVSSRHEPRLNTCSLDLLVCTVY